MFLDRSEGSSQTLQICGAVNAPDGKHSRRQTKRKFSIHSHI